MTKVGAATPNEVGQLADLYAEVFVDDPVWTAIVPSDPARRRVIRQAFKRELRGGRTRHVDVVRGPGARVIGCLNYQTPDGSSHAQTWWERALEAVVARVVPWARRSERHESVMATYHPAEPHWHLRDLVTSPAARGRGLGKALLENRLAIIDKNPLPVFLESTTPASRRLYERHGFKCVGTVSELAGTESFAMIRPASTKVS